MTLHPARRLHFQQRGMMLLECVVYVAVYLLILTLAFGALHRTWLAHKSIRRNAGDIASALNAGEQWRKDIRQATLPIELASAGEAVTLHIPTAAGIVTYQFAGTTVSRSSPGHPEPVSLLKNVQSSRMDPDRRSTLVAWRWELELQSTRKQAKLRPLFTFTAVPAGPQP